MFHDVFRRYLAVGIAAISLACGGGDDGGCGENCGGDGGTTGNVAAAGFVAEECVNWEFFCTHETLCPAGQACNTGVHTGQQWRGVCATLGCGPNGSVCSDNTFCQGNLVCNEYYRLGVEPSEDDPLMSVDGVPLKAQCRPAEEGQYCREDDDCAHKLTGLFCNSNYEPRQCRWNGLGDLCGGDGDCEKDDEIGKLTCNYGMLPCFLGTNPDCESEPFTSWNARPNYGYCSPRLDLGEPCMDDNDCLYESEISGDRLKCLRLDEPGYDPDGTDGQCYAPASGTTDSTLCSTKSDCEDDHVCMAMPGTCQKISNEGEPCVNSSYCYPSNDCMDGTCQSS